jgi:hypothetical protein
MMRFDSLGKIPIELGDVGGLANELFRDIDSSHLT